MEHGSQEILVTGATGAQGRAVIRHLLQRGYRVRALCRDPEKPAARALAEAGVRIAPGNLDDRASLDAAVNGVYGVFGVQNFWDGFPGPYLGFDGEVRQGKSLLDAAKAARVAHFIQTSAGGAGAPTGVPSTDSKREIEKHARGIKIPLTIIRPVFFMDNFDNPGWGFQQPILEGRLELPIDGEVKLQMIAVDDIGQFAARAFDRPKEFIGTAFDLAGDTLTMVEIAETFSRVMGREVRFVGGRERIAGLRAFNAELALIFEWFSAGGFDAFIPALRALHPGMLTFEDHLRRAGWEGRAAPA
jgi:uncharacterized protein YbjT (DUF2867 family)